uniref:Uncharacterized protein n=1 Tax=Mycena chlorophos TaxID=658473 RepID=A0ABQ0LM19_MYCCL|nr:predicted protein [Mycena chlorophos]
MHTGRHSICGHWSLAKKRERRVDGVVESEMRELPPWKLDVLDTNVQEFCAFETRRVAPSGNANARVEAANRVPQSKNAVLDFGQLVV